LEELPFDCGFCLTAATLFEGIFMSLCHDTLVIVDMQPDLSASRPDWLRQAVLKLIERARADNMAVVALEYLSYVPLRFYGTTYDELVECARTLPYFAMRAKAEADGSRRVAEALSAMNIHSERFIVCGINTHACVQATATGLTKLFPDSRIVVQANACNDFRGNNWSEFALAANLFVCHEMN